MNFDFRDFLKTPAAGLETMVRVANRWAAENNVTVMNVETLMEDPYRQSGIRIWYRTE